MIVGGVSRSAVSHRVTTSPMVVRVIVLTTSTHPLPLQISRNPSSKISNILCLCNFEALQNYTYLCLRGVVKKTMRFLKLGAGSKRHGDSNGIIQLCSSRLRTNLLVFGRNIIRIDNLSMVAIGSPFHFKYQYELSI